jgi:hypothetical protein
MRHIKLTSVDRVVALLTAALLVAAVMARIGPFSTVISEENLQVGYSRQILADAVISPGSVTTVKKSFSMLVTANLAHHGRTVTRKSSHDPQKNYRAGNGLI